MGKWYVAVMFRDGRSMSFEASTKESAEQTIKHVGENLMPGRVVKLGSLGAFRGEDVSGAYLTDEASVQESPSLFDAIFGKNR